MLNGTGNAQANVEIGRHGHTSLAHLMGGIVEAFIDGVAGGTDGATEGIGKRLYDLAELIADAAAARNHNLGCGELGTGGLLGRSKGINLDILPGCRRQWHWGRLSFHLLGLRRNGTRLQGINRAAASGLRSGLVGAAENGHRCRPIRLNGIHIDERTGSKAGGQAARNLVIRRAGGQNDGRRIGCAQGVQSINLGGHQALVIILRRCLHHLGGAEGG